MKIFLKIATDLAKTSLLFGFLFSGYFLIMDAGIEKALSANNLGALLGMTILSIIYCFMILSVTLAPLHFLLHITLWRRLTKTKYVCTYNAE